MFSSIHIAQTVVALQGYLGLTQLNDTFHVHNTSCPTFHDDKKNIYITNLLTEWWDRREYM